MKTTQKIVLTLALAWSTTLLFAQLPYLDKSGKAPKLMVDGKPFLILGGELHNSTGSDKAALQKVWKEMKEMHLNTVLAYAYWELLEPVEGKYNFELVDAAIEGAKKENLKIVLAWFGSWKSTASTYVPEWVKTNPKRFQRYTLENGKTLEILSPFSEVPSIGVRRMCRPSCTSHMLPRNRVQPLPMYFLVITTRQDAWCKRGQNRSTNFPA
jgi:hypothetical protein